jgi:hypothetical protein
MNPSLHHPSSHSGHDATIRNVVAFAHEVRVELRDSHVIVGSIMLAADCAVGAFRIRPWGLRSAMTVRLDDVARAVPVRRMVWALQRCISAAQVAGVFARPVPSPTNRGVVTALRFDAPRPAPNASSSSTGRRGRRRRRAA